MSRVFIVATGPSLSGIDLSGLSDKKVIAVNKSFQLVPTAQWLYFYDRRFYQWFANELKQFSGQLVSCASGAGENVDVRPKLKKFSEWEPGHLVGPDSGAHAITLAIDLGFRRIVLLGYDMKFTRIGKEVRSHWFGDYPLKSREHNYTERCLPFYDDLAEFARARGVEIVNANPDSALKVFPFVRLEQELDQD